jgi:hypothetical protein
MIYIGMRPHACSHLMQVTLTCATPSGAQVYHEMVVLERIHSQPQFCPGALLEALTSTPLRLH